MKFTSLFCFCFFFCIKMRFVHIPSGLILQFTFNICFIKSKLDQRWSKGLSDFKACLDYSYHHAQNLWKLEFSCSFVLNDMLLKGQIILKGLFVVLEFSQKTNKQIHRSSKNEFIFGRIRNYLTFRTIKEFLKKGC